MSFLAGTIFMSCTPTEPTEHNSLVGKWKTTSGVYFEISENNIIESIPPYSSYFPFVYNSDYQWIGQDSIIVEHNPNSEISYNTRSKVIFHTPDSVTLTKYHMGLAAVYPPEFNDVTLVRINEEVQQPSILGKWHLTKISLGFGGIFYWQRDWITYDFKENPSIVTVFVSDAVREANQPFYAPFTESGDYSYSTDGYRIAFADGSAGCSFYFTEDGNLVLDEGMDADGAGYFFER
jgi:hypothetical protein